MRARALLTCKDPKHKGKALCCRHELGKLCVPKKEVPIPINPPGTWQHPPKPKVTIEHSSLNSHLFKVVFSGIHLNFCFL